MTRMNREPMRYLISVPCTRNWGHQIYQYSDLLQIVRLSPYPFVALAYTCQKKDQQGETRKLLQRDICGMILPFLLLGGTYASKLSSIAKQI